jgi:hypothetical protein
VARGAKPERRRSKDDIARERLKPLREGERPLALTIGAVIAGLLVVAWVVALALGDSDVAGAAPFAALLAAAAAGMWLRRYWAVLGFQVLLALTLVNALLFLILRADEPLDFVIGAALIGGAGALFWGLVRSLARLQMPSRRPSEPSQG